MKITSRMFADHLRQHLIHTAIHTNDNVGYESVELYFSGETVLESNKAYVVDGLQLCTLADIDPSCLIISSAGQIVGLPCSVLTCSGSLGEVYKAALEAIHHYAQLERSLNEGLIKDEQIEYFLKVCAGFFRNLLQILDPALNVIAGLSPVLEREDENPAAFEEMSTGFSAELVSEMAKRNLLRQTFEFQSAQYLKTPLFSNGAIHLNLFEGDQYLGKLLLIENLTPFTSGTADVVNFVGKYFIHLLTKRTPVINANLFTAEYFVSEILCGRIKDVSFVTDQLSSIGWRIHDTYCIFYIQINSLELVNYYVQLLAHKLNDALVFPLEDGLVAVINLKNGNKDTLDAENYVTQFLEKSRLFCGFSEPFQNFLSADTFFQQAKSAAHLGMKSDPTRHLFHYSDFAIQQLISAAVSLQFEKAFIPPAIYAIMEYDKDNGSDYFHTLKVYLESGTNQVLTAKRLHIHRNSLKYRLARLKEIAYIDPDDAEQRLRLILAYRLIEFTNN